MRVLVCGGRSYSDRYSLFDVLDALPIERLIAGDASGADTLAHIWAHERSVPIDRYEADWQKHGRAAGPIRNQRMLDEGKPELVVAAPGGNGTADMVRRARRAGVQVITV